MKIGQGAIKGIFFTGSPEYTIHIQKQAFIKSAQWATGERERKKLV